MKNDSIFALAISKQYTLNESRHNGALAQLVEQWTENPCVPGSIPGGTTSKTTLYEWFFLFLFRKKATKTPPLFHLFFDKYYHLTNHQTLKPNPINILLQFFRTFK